MMRRAPRSALFDFNLLSLDAYKVWLQMPRRAEGLDVSKDGVSVGAAPMVVQGVRITRIQISVSGVPMLP